MFVIEHAVAESFEVRVGDLVAELLAHTLRFGGHFPAAGAIPVAARQAFFYDLHDLFVWVQSDLHSKLLFCFSIAQTSGKGKFFIVHPLFLLPKTLKSIIIKKNHKTETRK